MIEMPNDMNGLLKSITRSRSAVIVMGAIAISASCTKRTKIMYTMINRGDNFMLSLIAATVVVDAVIVVADGVSKIIKVGRVVKATI